MTAVSSGTSFHVPRTEPALSNIAKTTSIRCKGIPLRMTQSEDVDSPSPSSFNKKLIIPIAALTSISATTIAAFTGHLPGPPVDATAPPFFANLPFGVLFAGSFEAYSPTLIYRDLAATVFSILAAILFVKACTYPVTVGKLQPRDSRKIIHTFSAPLFILVWPLFSSAYGARVFASIVPLMNAFRLYLAGTGSSGDNTSERSNSDGSESELAQAISRSGNAEEALGGPFVYVMVLLFFTFFCFTDSPVGIISIATMAVGDGLADLLGRRFGSTNKWPFNKNKSIAGSVAFVSGSLVGSLGLISWLTGFGVMDPIDLSTAELVVRLFVISVLCAAVELIPAGDDNYSVPLSAAILSSYLLT
jgi:dolichol kinase